MQHRARENMCRVSSSEKNNHNHEFKTKCMKKLPIVKVWFNIIRPSSLFPGDKIIINVTNLTVNRDIDRNDITFDRQ